MKNNFKHIIGPISGLCFFLCASNVSAQLSATELARIFAEDAAQGDSYGYAVDIDGDRAVIGARFVDERNDQGQILVNNTGAAYVYLRNPQTGLWEADETGKEHGQLVMAGAEPGDQFGSSVAIDGDVIVVGAPQDDINQVAFKGSAHVFTRGPEGWDNGVELLPGDEDINPIYENYGISVDIDNGTIVVGVAFDDEKNDGRTSGASGSAYVYEKVLEDWTMKARLLPPGTADHQNFGWSVAIDRNIIIVGAPHWTGSGFGEAYLFGRLDGVWGSEAKQLPATDNLTEDQFGWSVAISGDIAVVGARMDDDVDKGTTDSGSITVFDRSSGGWSNKGKLLASNGELNDRFGSDVATNGEAVIAGAPQNGSFNRGSFYSFSSSGSDWSESEVIEPLKNPGNVSTIQQFGTSVALDGGSLIVGAPASDINNGSTTVFFPGAAFIYGLNATAIPTFDGSEFLTIRSPPGTFLINVIAIDPATLGGSALNVSSPLGVNLPQDVSFPLGALGFDVNGLTPGAAVEVEIEFPEEVPVSSYFKFSDDWYEFLDDGTTGATVTPGKVKLKFVDGGRGDHDGVADGVITDPGALSAIIISDTLFEDGFED